MQRKKIIQQHNVDLSYGSQLRGHRTVGANKATGKEIPVEKSKRDQMMDLEKTLWETRNLDMALQNLMQALRFFTANVGTWLAGVLKLQMWIC